MVLVEDNPADALMVRRAMEANNVQANLMVREDGEAGFNYLAQLDSDPSIPCPVMLLLDLNLPLQSGADLLKYVRESTRYKTIPVVILTSSDSPADREKVARLGANRYFLKPISYHEFLTLGEMINELLTRPRF